VLVVQQFDALLIGGDGLALDAENLEEIIVEALGFTLFIMGVLPFLRKRLGAPFDFIPAQTHYAFVAFMRSFCPLSRCGSRERRFCPTRRSIMFNGVTLSSLTPLISSWSKRGG
jgi:hypothetical protein